MKINEIFGGPKVVQGEGPFAGRPATFIRMFGCVAPYCKFCDSKYSWTDEKKESKEMNINQIVNKVKKFGKNKLVVITGGEPFAQDEIYELINQLLKQNFDVQIETSGKAKIDRRLYEGFDCHIVMSPKQYNGKFLIHKENHRFCADDYKFVVENEKEVKNAIKFIKKFGLYKIPAYEDNLWLMAKGETREKQLYLMPKVFEWCNKYGFKYSPRLHVLAFNVKRGV